MDPLTRVLSIEFVYNSSRVMRLKTLIKELNNDNPIQLTGDHKMYV